jgi:hypothetical protein
MVGCPTARHLPWRACLLVESVNIVKGKALLHRSWALPFTTATCLTACAPPETPQDNLLPTSSVPYLLMLHAGSVPSCCIGGLR